MQGTFLMSQAILSVITGALIVTSVAAAAFAQTRLGGARPAFVTQHQGTTAEGRGDGQTSRQPAPAEPTLSLSLIDPGPIGIETTTGSFSVTVPPGGARVLNATPVNPGDPLRSGWARLEFGGNTIHFAHIAVGAGWSTGFSIVNTGGAAMDGTLVLTDQNGNPLTVRVSDSSPEVGALAPMDRVALAGGLGGVATFQLVEGGTLRTIAGVLESSPVQFATIPVDDNNTQQRFTGYAVANPTNENVTVRLALVGENGNVVEDIAPAGLSPLGPGRQVARFLFQDLPARSTFRGSMVLRAQGTGRIVVVALVSNRGLFSAIPVVPEKAPNVPN